MPDTSKVLKEKKDENLIETFRKNYETVDRTRGKHDRILADTKLTENWERESN